jgi:hypothetical protein
MTAAALMSRHTSAWQAATVHPFLAGVQDGSTPGRELGAVRERRPDPGLSFLRTAPRELRFGSCTRIACLLPAGQFQHPVVDVVGVPGQLLLVVDDVNRSLLGGGCASVDTDVISQQVRVYVFAKPLVRRDKSTCSRASNLISLRKFGLPLGFVGALLFVLVERVIYPHGRIRLFLG